jgi:hypothetical protein
MGPQSLKEPLLAIASLSYVDERVILVERIDTYLFPKIDRWSLYISFRRCPGKFRRPQKTSCSFQKRP